MNLGILHVPLTVILLEIVMKKSFFFVFFSDVKKMAEPDFAI